MTMTNATHIVECEGPSDAGGKARHPSLSLHYSCDAAEFFINSRLALGADIPLKYKHIWGIRAVGAQAGDWLFRAAG